MTDSIAAVSYIQNTSVDTKKNLCATCCPWGNKDDTDDNSSTASACDKVAYDELSQADQLRMIRDHPARERQRLSRVPDTTSIAEDQVLETLCYDSGFEPEKPADQLSRGARKIMVRKMSLNLYQGRSRAGSTQSDVTALVHGDVKSNMSQYIKDVIGANDDDADDEGAIKFGHQRGSVYSQTFTQRRDSIMSTTSGATEIDSFRLEQFRARVFSGIRRGSTCPNSVKTEPRFAESITKKLGGKADYSLIVDGRTSGDTARAASVFDDADLAAFTTGAETLGQRRASVRRASIAAKVTTAAPQMTDEGKSQYPLPGSNLTTRKGGTYTTTKAAHNLISEDEILIEMQKTIEKIIERENRERENQALRKEQSATGLPNNSSRTQIVSSTNLVDREARRERRKKIKKNAP